MKVGGNMSEMMSPVKLHNGTLIRHRVTGYEGRIEGITEIKACFTARGVSLDNSSSKHTFQYRVVVSGESIRRIAPAEDLEILEGVTEIICPSCRFSFQTKPGFSGKPAGRCDCGRWICPSCLACQGPNEEMSPSRKSQCLKQRKRQAKKMLLQKTGSAG